MRVQAFVGIVVMLLVAPVVAVIYSPERSLVPMARVPVQTTGQVCTGVTWWFPDASTRTRPRRDRVTPILALYNGTAVDQTVKVLTRSNGTGDSITATVPAFRRASVDLSTLVPGNADFAVEVEFSGIGAADLKMVGETTVASTGLPLCR